MKPFLVFLTVFAGCGAVQAQPVCEAILLQDAQPESLTSFVTPEIRTYRQNISLLQKIIDHDPKQMAHVEHLLQASEFFDNAFMVRKIIPEMASGRRAAIDFSRLFDHGEAPGVPFSGYISAKAYLDQNNPEPDFMTLQSIHQYVMDNGVEGLQRKDLGAVRSVPVAGNSVLDTNFGVDWRLSAEEVRAVLENPYLNWAPTRQEEDAPNRFWANVKIWGAEKDYRLKSDSRILHTGQILYPSITTARPELLNLVQDFYPELFEQIVSYRKAYPGQQPAPPGLQQQFVQALLEERFARFTSARQTLGHIDLDHNVVAYIDLVADFQRDLVSIHPFLNGNGRTTLLLMNYLLTKEHLPPVLLVDPFQDLQQSPLQWRATVRRGMQAAAAFRADVLQRVQNNWVPDYSPLLISPALPSQISIDAIKQGAANSLKKNVALAEIDKDQFAAFVKTALGTVPGLAVEIQQRTLETMSQLVSLFTEFARSKTIRYIHDKDGDKEMRLRLVDPDFVDSFGVIQAYRKDRWNEKIERWYDHETLLWRGLSNRSHVYTNEELLNFFIAPSAHMASNHSARFQGSALLAEMKVDFETYNRELLNGQLIDMANDHHKEGPRYGNSYGLSTSKREIVGKAFAMGAMVIAPYGRHNTPELQAQLKSRINIATYRAAKDVDLGRLKAFDHGFSYIYGRQAEVMAIGGADPDSVMLIQKIDADGHVMETLARNPKDPSQIVVLSGRWVPNEEPLPLERIKKMYRIQENGTVVVDEVQDQKLPSLPENHPFTKTPAKLVQDNAPVKKSVEKSVVRRVFSMFR